jgi:hypothetical protein
LDDSNCIIIAFKLSFELPILFSRELLEYTFPALHLSSSPAIMQLCKNPTADPKVSEDLIMPAATTTGANGLSPQGAQGASANDNIRRFAAPSRPLSPRAEHTLFHDKTRCFVYGLQPRAVQGMLDFDFICKRKTPSVAGIIYTFGGQFVSKMYWGTSETLLPVYQDVDKAMAKHSDVDTIVNFASSRSVYSSTMELMNYPQIKSIAIIAEGVPERVSHGLKIAKANLASNYC